MNCRILLLTALLLLGSAVASGEEMVFYSNLSVSSFGADGFSYAVVPYGWILSSELRLTEDGNEVEYRTGRSMYARQPVWLSVARFGCQPPYTSYVQVAEADGVLDDYGWFWELRINHGMTPPLAVTVSGDGDAWDGSSGHFSLSVPCGAPGDYDWNYTAPAGAGNNPNVAFHRADPSVSTNAHWFAHPNVQCPPDPSEYQILGSAHAFGDWWHASSPFRVHTPTRGGVTYSPAVAGHVTLQCCTNGRWTVGQNNYFRTEPQVAINVMPASQFRTKVDAHEEVHRTQFTTGIFSSYWNPVAAYNRVKDLTDTSQAALDSRISAEVQAYNLEQDALVRARWETDAEPPAYAVSDPIAPHFRYQAVCRPSQ